MPDFVTAIFASKSAASGWLYGGEIILLFGAALVVVGLIGEARSRRRIFEFLVIAGVAAELMGDGVVFAASSALQTLQDRELFEARLQAANRNLSKLEIDTLAITLSDFAGQSAEVIEFPVTFEHDYIAIEIMAVLLSAKWNVSAVNRLSTPPEGMLVQGVFIRATEDERSQAAAKALFDALKSTAAGPGFNPSPLPHSENPRVQVLVGDKPTPLRQWVKP